MYFRIALLVAAGLSSSCYDVQSDPSPYGFTSPSGTVVGCFEPASNCENVSIDFIRIEGGAFRADEDLRYQVLVPTFMISRTEVTVTQYAACVEAGVCIALDSIDAEAASSGELPVTRVTWSEARQFAQFVGGRLPTESEWEYTARSGGVNQLYPWGSEMARCGLANLGGCGNQILPVCATPRGSSDQGVCDLAGNVSEWVEDDFSSDRNHQMPNDGTPFVRRPRLDRRVVRGGHFRSDPDEIRTTFRDKERPERRSELIGFRVVRPIDSF